MRNVALVFAFLFSAFSALAAENSAILGMAEKGDLKALNQAFVLHTKTDGGDAEDIDIAIGKSIVQNPKSFLTALKKNRSKLPRLDAILGNPGPEFVDDFKMRKNELQKRLKAIQSVKDSSLQATRAECESELRKQIERTKPSEQ